MSHQRDRLEQALSNRYRLERELGRGGMAVVYLADDLKHRRKVAIKVLRPELAAVVGVERFLHEIAVTASLQHPHILQLLDSGEADGFLYYVMAYVDGESLREKLNREKQLTLEESLAITVSVAQALEYAHQHDVIHRDIKPENILLSGGEPVVADFGIALAISAAAGKRLTETGLSLGTPSYMSPEQATGARDVDGRTDVYSLACVLYELLAGEPPFTGPSARAILAKHTLERVPSLRVVRESVPDVLERVITKALAKTPADRHRSAASFAAALREAASTIDSGQLRQLPEPRRTPWLPIAGVATVLAIVATILLVRGPRPPIDRPSEPLDARRIAVLYLENRGPMDLAYLAESVTEELIDMLSNTEILSVIPPSGVLQYRGEQPPLDSIVRALQVGTLIDGSVMGAGDRVRVTLRLTDAVSVRQLGSTTIEALLAEPLQLRDALADSVQVFLREHVGPEINVLIRRAGTTSDVAWRLVQQAERERKVARVLREEGNLDRSARAIERADSLVAHAESFDQTWVEPVVLSGWIALDRVDLLVDRSRSIGGAVDSAVQAALERAIALGERAVALSGDDPWALELRGVARYRLYDPPVALEVRDREARLREAEQDLRAAIATHPWPARALSTLSDLVRRRGALQEARVLAERALAADRFLAATGNSTFGLAQVMMDDGQYDAAAALCREAGRRLLDDPRWPLCQLTAMASDEDAHGDPWVAAEELVGRSRPDARALYRAQGRMLVTLAFAERGLVDSARAVLERTLAEGPTDEPRLAYYEAAAWVRLGEREPSLRALERLFSAHPQFRTLVANDAWFGDLQSDARFRTLVDSTR